VRQLCDSSVLFAVPHSLEGTDAAQTREDPLDPAELGAVVRALALQAHKILRRGATGKFSDLHILHHQLDRLQTRLNQLRLLHALRFDELQRWLARLSQVIKDRDRECSG
jgi:hypothetical protein